MSDSVRWYKGKEKVQIVLKSRMNYLVVPEEGCAFVTVPRLLWRHPKEALK